MTVDDRTAAFADRLAATAGAVIRPFFRRRIDVTDKGKRAYDPVTLADQGAETAMRDLIARECPNDGILGEEYGEKSGTSGRRWVLDPLDGTRAFITGRHEWGTLIALEDGGVPRLGILDQPVLGERFTGANGKSEMRVAGKTTPLATRPCARLSEAILCATDPSFYFSADEQASFARVAQQAKLTRYGGDCYLFAVLALGFVDLVIEAGFNAWDVSALIPIVEGAGGGRILAAGDARVHAEAIKLLA